LLYYHFFPQTILEATQTQLREHANNEETFDHEDWNMRTGLIRNMGDDSTPAQPATAASDPKNEKEQTRTPAKSKDVSKVIGGDDTEEVHFNHSTFCFL